MSTPLEERVAQNDKNFRVFWLTQKHKRNLAAMLVQLDAGMSTSAAFQIAAAEVDNLYREACRLEGVPVKNHMLDPVAVDLQARFALDALFLAIKGGLCESEVRKQFWSIFRKATTPSLTA